jgi:hypothetical protein
MYLLETAPIWVIGLAILAALMLAEQIGYAGRQFRGRRGAADPGDAGIGFVLTGALGLLGLLVAFTFGAASNRFDTRRMLVVEEANAIGTTYLRIQALDDAPKTALSQLMVQYVRARGAWFRAGEDPVRLAQTEAATEDLQNKIWAATLADVRANPTATINPSLFQTTNDMFDLAASARAATDARLPISILRAVMLYALISAAIMGYSMAKGTRQQIVSLALYLALSVAMCLILDLDRPRSGTVRVSDAAMERAIAAVENAEAAKAAAPPARPAS